MSEISVQFIVDLFQSVAIILSGLTILLIVKRLDIHENRILGDK